MQMPKSSHSWLVLGVITPAGMIEIPIGMGGVETFELAHLAPSLKELRVDGLKFLPCGSGAYRLFVRSFPGVLTLYWVNPLTRAVFCTEYEQVEKSEIGLTPYHVACFTLGQHCLLFGFRSTELCPIKTTSLFLTARPTMCA